MSRWIIAPRGVVELGQVIPEIFVDGIGAVENSGPNLRFHLFSRQETFEEEATTQRVIVLRVMTPRDTLPITIGQLAHCLVFGSGEPELVPKPRLVK